MLPNFVLIGFMGSGKSSAGRRLASLTGYRFIDTDELIIQREGRPISGIFAKEGELYFRGVEEQVLLELIDLKGVVLSTGGGLVVRPSNRALLKKIGVIAWLDQEPDVLFERAARSGRRPLLQTANPRESFDRLLNERSGIYKEAADFRIDATHLTVDEVAQAVLDETKRLGKSFDS